MSLGFHFSLTPAQVRLLITIAAERFDSDALHLPRWPVAPGQPDHFVSIAHRLIAKGLVKHEHDPDGPSYTATEQGCAIARRILDDAHELVRIGRPLRRART